MDHAALFGVLRRTKAAACVVGLVLSSLVLVASLLVTSLAMWLQTSGGHAWIAGALAREASTRLGFTLSVGRISGSIVRGIRIEQIALHDGQRRLVARADALSAHYRLRRLIRVHEVDELVLTRPTIVRVPAPVAHEPSRHAESTTFSVHSLRIVDGSVRAHDHVVFVRADAELVGGRARVSADLHGAAFRARGHGEWADGRLTAALESLDVDASLVDKAQPWAGSGSLHARGTLAGPLDALALQLRGHTRDRGLALSALVDVLRRTARLTAAVAAPTRSGRLHARGMLRGGTLDVTALEARSGGTRLIGSAQADARALHATLDARVAPAEAVLIGIDPVAPIRLRAALDGPLRAVDVRVQGRLRRAHVALAGRVNALDRRGDVRFVARDISLPLILRDATPLVFSGAFRFDGALRAHAGLQGGLSVTDGTLRVAGLSFDRLRGAGRVRLARSGEAQVDALSGRFRGRRLRQVATQATIHWDRKAVYCHASQAILDGSRAAGDLVYTLDPLTRRPRVTVDARSLSLSPALVQEVLLRRPPRAWPGHAKLVWTGNDVGLTFALETDQGPASGRARLRRGGGALELSDVDVDVAGSRLRGTARVQNGEVVASLDELLLQPRLVHSLSPSLDPARPIRMHGAVAGPLHALDLHLLASAGASTARVRGWLDVPARSFRLFAVLDTFYLQSIKKTTTSRINLELSALGRFVDGGVVGTLTVRHVWGEIEKLPLEAGRLDAKLDGPRFQVEQVLLGVPGAVLEGGGGGSYRDFHVKYGVVITDALALKRVPKSLRVMVGVTALTPGRSVVGAVHRQAGGDIGVSYRAIPPPFRVVNLLYHLMIGRPLHLTVQ